MIGYILTPDTSAKVFFLLQGVPNSGKSVLSSLILSLLSEESTISLDIHAFSEKFSVSSLTGKAVCISPDLPSEPLSTKTVSKIKQLTGNDIVTSDVKFSSRVKFHSLAKYIFVTNHALLCKANDSAFYDRAITIPFQYSIPRGSENTFLLDNMKAERDGIVTRAIHAYLNLIDRNYRFSGDYPVNSVVTQTNNDTYDISKYILEFMQHHFEHESDSIVFIEDAYDKFVRNQSYISKNEFSHYFKEYAREYFGGTDSRKRKNSKGNALSCIIGIKWIQEFKY